MFDFTKKKKRTRKMAQITLGLDMKRCSECLGPTRPCEIGGVKALFHRGVEEEQALLHINVYERPEAQAEIVRRFREEGIFGPACSVEKQRSCRALIEWLDGSVSLVEVQHIKFLDCAEG